MSILEITIATFFILIVPLSLLTIVLLEYRRKKSYQEYRSKRYVHTQQMSKM